MRLRDEPSNHSFKIGVHGMEIETVNRVPGFVKTYEPKLVEARNGVSRDALFQYLARAGYSKPAVPVEPLPSEVEPQYADNRSYFFPR